MKLVLRSAAIAVATVAAGVTLQIGGSPAWAAENCASYTDTEGKTTQWCQDTDGSWYEPGPNGTKLHVPPPDAGDTAAATPAVVSTPADPSSDSSSDDSGLIWAGAAGGVGLLAVVGGAIWVRGSRRGRADS